eukprot:SAG11_NODE_4830_length_1751_cov_2.190073_3_plen_154_part_00
MLLINKQLGVQRGDDEGDGDGEGEHALPLKLSGSGKISSMLLAGPLIDDVNAQNGGYSHGGAPTKTIRAAAQDVAKAGGFKLTSMFGTSSGASSVVAHNTSAIDATVAAAAEADVAVLVLGDDITTCAEMGDRSSLSLLGVPSKYLCTSFQAT